MAAEKHGNFIVIHLQIVVLVLYDSLKRRVGQRNDIHARLLDKDCEVHPLVVEAHHAVVVAGLSEGRIL